MYQAFLSMLKKPPLYTKTQTPFWDDEHISGQMLNAHLDPDFEGASRKLPFIEASVRWIEGLVPAAGYRRLIDFGCGPGIYAEKFARAGYNVTGVDLSRRSIRYAVESAEKERLEIRYLRQNYLRMDLGEAFDFATMIYCDYGALSTDDRKALMRTVHRHLRPGGRFLLDVFSTVSYRGFHESQTWEICENGGFWSREPYIGFHGRYQYPENATLEHTAVISEAGVRHFYLWNTSFSPEALRREAADAGFQVRGLYGDAAGAPYREESPTIAILLEKEGDGEVRTEPTREGRAVPTE